MKRKSLNGSQQLTTREEVFVENVAAGENQTKAVEKAGYSKRSAKVIGSQLLNKKIVQDAIRERKAHAYRANDLCAEMVVGALNEIAFAPTQLIIREDGAVDVAEARRLGLTHLIKRIRVTPTPFGEKTEVEFYSRLDALKKLAEIKEIRQPQGLNENEEIRAQFDYVVQGFIEDKTVSPEEARETLLEIYEKMRPDYFERLVRAGVEGSDRYDLGTR